MGTEDTPVELRCSEWSEERLLWEMVYKSDPRRLAIVAFELMWRQEHGQAEG